MLYTFYFFWLKSSLYATFLSPNGLSDFMLLVWYWHSMQRTNKPGMAKVGVGRKPQSLHGDPKNLVETFLLTFCCTVPPFCCYFGLCRSNIIFLRRITPMWHKRTVLRSFCCRKTTVLVVCIVWKYLNFSIFGNLKGSRSKSSRISPKIFRWGFSLVQMAFLNILTEMKNVHWNGFA